MNKNCYTYIYICKDLFVNKNYDLHKLLTVLLQTGHQLVFLSRLLGKAECKLYSFAFLKFILDYQVIT